MNALELLKKYKESSRDINNELRKGNLTLENTAIDALFSKKEVPSTLYRLIDNKHVQFEGGIFCDPAYLSCTDDVDEFIGKTGPKEHIACLKINMVSPFLCINVKEVLTDYDDEGEYILPRKTKLKLVEEPMVYSGVSQLEEFLDEFDCNIGSKQLWGEGIRTISLYTLEFVKE